MFPYQLASQSGCAHFSREVVMVLTAVFSQLCH